MYVATGLSSVNLTYDNIGVKLGNYQEFLAISVHSKSKLFAEEEKYMDEGPQGP